MESSCKGCQWPLHPIPTPLPIIYIRYRTTSSMAMSTEYAAPVSTSPASDPTKACSVPQASTWMPTLPPVAAPPCPPLPFLWVSPHRCPIMALSQAGIQSQYLWTESTGRKATGRWPQGLSINFDNACIVYFSFNVADTASICTEDSRQGCPSSTFSFAYMVIGGADMGFDVIVDELRKDSLTRRWSLWISRHSAEWGGSACLST